MEPSDDHKRMYCFATSTGYFVVRQNEQIYVSGNSGKGFSTSNFIRSESYKQFNVDDLKERVVAIAKKEVDRLQKEGNSIDSTTAKLASINFKNQDDVAFLHQFVKDRGLEDKKLKLFVQSASEIPKDKPNILFDMTFKSIRDAEKKFGYFKDLGYDPKNIHVVWVLTDYEVALDNNQNRERVVPEIILKGAHTNVGRTLVDALLNNKLPSFINGEFHIIFGNPTNSVPWRDSDGNVIKIQDRKDKTKFNKVTQSFKSIKVKERGKPVDSKLVANALNDIVKALPDQMFSLKGIKKGNKSF
jgi:hypothetical protein